MFKVDLMPSGDGQPWDDQGLGQVVGFVISFSAYMVYSLRFFYVKDNINQTSKQHGNINGNSEMIMLNYSTEFLTEMHGVRGIWSGSKIVKSITFVTNKATYGPFGGSRDTYYLEHMFDIKFGGKNGMFKGFYGTIYKGYIETIGVYIQIPTSSLSQSLGQVKLETNSD